MSRMLVALFTLALLVGCAAPSVVRTERPISRSASQIAPPKQDCQRPARWEYDYETGRDICKLPDVIAVPVEPGYQSFYLQYGRSAGWWGGGWWGGGGGCTPGYFRGPNGCYR